jgi:hypothetical protein
VDFAQTAQAHRNREAKAARLVVAFERLGCTLADLTMSGGRRADIRRAAGVARTGEDTWWMAEQILRARGHRDAEPVDVDEDGPAVVVDEPPIPPLVLDLAAVIPPILRIVEAVVGTSSPDPDPDPVRAPLECWVPSCEAIGAGVHLYPGGPYCDAHAPWARTGRGRVIPPAGTTLAERMTAAGRRPGGPARSHTVVDDRAIASGKRRSSAQEYRAGTAAEEARRG